MDVAAQESELEDSEDLETVFDDSTETEIAGDDLKVISGIGPAYERRLNDVGIHTYADLAAQAPEKLRSIVGLKTWQATDLDDWIAEAQTLSEAKTG